MLPRGKVRWAVGFSPSADLVYADQDPVGLQAEISARYGIGTLQLRWEDWSCQMRRRTFDSVTFDEADLRQNNLIW